MRSGRFRDVKYHEMSVFETAEAAKFASPPAGASGGACGGRLPLFTLSYDFAAPFGIRTPLDLNFGAAPLVQIRIEFSQSTPIVIEI